MSTVDVSKLGVKVWPQKNILPQGNCLHSLMKPIITRQIHFELIDIEYDLIKY